MATRTLVIEKGSAPMGMSIQRNVVAKVTPTGPAAKAGLVAGDRIQTVVVAGEPKSTAGLTQVQMTALIKKAGKTIELTVSSGEVPAAASPMTKRKANVPVIAYNDPSEATTTPAAAAAPAAPAVSDPAAAATTPASAAPLVSTLPPPAKKTPSPPSEPAAEPAPAPAAEPAPAPAPAAEPEPVPVAKEDPVPVPAEAAPLPPPPEAPAPPAPEPTAEPSPPELPPPPPAAESVEPAPADAEDPVLPPANDPPPPAAPAAVPSSPAAGAPVVAEAGVCHKCKLPITDAFLFAGNLSFHKECFTCFTCQASLESQSFTVEGDSPTCQTCWVKHKGLTCHACNQIIQPDASGRVAYKSVQDVNYHHECFVCHECKKPFPGGGAYPVGEFIYCHEHALARLQ